MRRSLLVTTPDEATTATRARIAASVKCNRKVHRFRCALNRFSAPEKTANVNSDHYRRWN
jgi:hypothetical protein